MGFVLKAPANEQRNLAFGQSMPARLPTKILFPHIPKTAGTSLITVLGNLFGEGNIYRYTQESTPPERMPLLLQEMFRTHAVLIGHIPVHFWERLFESAPAITVLRDPIDRVISLFRFLKTRPPEETRIRMGLRENFTFEEFLTGASPGVFTQVNNGMCFFLGSTMANERLSIESDPAMMFYNAKVNLGRMSFAFVDTLPERLNAWTRGWGIPFPVRLPYENATKDLSCTFSSAERAEIVARNSFDIMLYRWAKLIDRGLNAHALLQVRRPTKIPVCEIPGRAGFDAAEQTGIAWVTEEGRGEIHCLGDGQAVTVELGLYFPVENYPVDSVQLYVNDKRLVPEVQIVDRNRSSLVIKDLFLEAGINTITIRPSVFIPACDVVPETLDRRSLSVALQHICFS